MPTRIMFLLLAILAIWLLLTPTGRVLIKGFADSVKRAANPPINTPKGAGMGKGQGIGGGAGAVD